MFRFVVLVGLLAAVHGQTTQISECVNHEGVLPINVHIEGCNVPPCDLPQLQDAVIHIVFKAPRTIKSMRTLAFAYLFTLEINYNLADNADTCKFITNSYCPVVKDEVLMYTLRMPIEPYFPVNTRTTIEFQLTDENEEGLICIRVPIKITPPDTGDLNN